MTSQIKPLEILVIEDRGDLVSDVSELMRKTEKCSEIPIKITHREEYAPDIAEIAGSHDVIVTDIGLPGKRLSYELPEEEYENFELVYLITEHSDRRGKVIHIDPYLTRK